MDPTDGPAPSVSSTAASSCVSSQSPPSTPSPTLPPLLEVSMISAQDLAPVSKSMRTYAVAWINPSRKLTTRTDQQGNTHPTWNDKFTFRVDDNEALNVEIYTASWFRPLLVGTTQVLIADLLSPPTGTMTPLDKNHPDGTRFITLQVRRPSGAPQGILTMGVSLLDSTARSLPIEHQANMTKIEKIPYNLKQEDEHNKENLHLWRSLSVGSELVHNDDFPLKPGSVYNGGGSMVNGSVCNSSIVNGSELCSDIGPSASIVAAELDKKAAQQTLPSPVLQGMPPGSIVNAPAVETGSSILQELTLEEARANGYRINRTNVKRCRKENIYSGDESSELSMVSVNRNSRRKSDGGLFSCFGNAYGIEVRIVCGSSNNPSSKKAGNSASRKKIKSSSDQ